MPQGKWRFPEEDSFGAMIFQMIYTSREMGITLTEFMELPRDEKAMQITYTQIMSKVKAVDAQENADKIRRKSKAK